MGKAVVKIKDITDALEETMEDWGQFLNTETGKIEMIPDGDN